MAAGELSPWAAGPVAPTGPPSGQPTGASYAGPWVPSSTPPTYGGYGDVNPGQRGLYGGNLPPVVGAWAPRPLTDAELHRLPPPMVRAPADQRPAVIGLAVTLAVTAALLWVCALSLMWLVALAGTQAISPVSDDGYVFHTLDQFVLRMSDGLWVPLYGFPVASVVTGFLLLSRRPWARVAHSVLGVATLGWVGWWLRGSPLAWGVVTVYVGLSVAVLWAPSVGRWYADRPRRSRPGRQQLNG